MAVSEKLEAILERDYLPKQLQVFMGCFLYISRFFSHRRSAPDRHSPAGHCRSGSPARAGRAMSRQTRFHGNGVDSGGVNGMNSHKSSIL